MLTKPQRHLLLDVASRSIECGLRSGRPLAVDPAEHVAELAAPGASFVTLRIDGQLRGCVGSLEPRRPLISDAAQNAYSSAFRDRRFPPLGWDELPKLQIHISVLTPPEPMSFTSEAGALAQIRPGVDGLILAAGGQRGTLIPAFWKTEPDRQKFWQHLKRKAGLAADYWPDDVQLYRYTAESFGSGE